MFRVLFGIFVMVLVGAVVFHQQDCRFIDRNGTNEPPRAGEYEFPLAGVTVRCGASGPGHR
jgi:hypothetical protein